MKKKKTVCCLSVGDFEQNILINGVHFTNFGEK